jgi:hypothetical protein
LEHAARRLMVRITPIMAQAGQYGPFVQWRGDLVVHTVHGTKKSFRVSAEDSVGLSEVGVMISWPDDEPTGKFIPWGEIVSIEQVPPEQDQG